jgi:hypothetical protein
MSDFPGPTQVKNLLPLWRAKERASSAEIRAELPPPHHFIRLQLDHESPPIVPQVQ